jgi:dCMP deaminase
MQVADAIAQRSNCIRKYGAVIVDANQRIVATGYNGTPALWSTAAHNDDARFLICGDCREYCPHARLGPGEPKGYDDCFSIHAEANALLFCDRREREGGSIYITTIPCWDCAKMIANSGLHRVLYRADGIEYRSRDAVLSLFVACDMNVVAMR